ncbi:FkbM family methyltransferase [Aureimonas psammosilenae]|uniref:FkbM family methyltransferase n=1 Tax=Aureimonas psammosilenae TaxID=2495496 RepID=UPI001260B748|nr:FkbM family methyltransferase [Aureimonas psammosilenae]
MSFALPPILMAEASLADLASLGRSLDDAKAKGAEWVAFHAPGERLADDAALLAAPAFDMFDVVFGAVAVGSPPALWRPSRLAFDEPARLAHALLHWFVGEPRFWRVEALDHFLQGANEGEGRIERLFRLWNEARCIKLAAPLAVLDAEPLPLTADERHEIIARLEERPVFLDVRHEGVAYRLPYTGRNAGIERDQTRGSFFEAGELEVLRARLGSGRRVVDVGANTGNHTVFFAGPMAASHVLPFEPSPEAAKALAQAVEANGLSNVDLSMMGTGVGAREERMRIVSSERGGLGAGHLAEGAGEGSIPVVRLDDVLTQAPDLLKIDVEGMELDVLEGAKATIASARPLIFIEIANANTAQFMRWLDLAGYRIERIFSDKGHANYLIAPRG